jgi:uncharacterized coiled-coil protein SlyX
MVGDMRGIAVTYPTDDDDGYESTDEESGRGLPRLLFVYALLAATGIASGFLWRAYSNDVSVFSLVASVTGSIASTDGKPVGQSDIETLRQQAANAAQTAAAQLAAQQAEIKRLSDQVSALSGRLDLLQRPVTSAQAAMPSPVPHAAAQRKKPELAKPVAVKPAGAISTGGAPLAPPVQLLH